MSSIAKFRNQFIASNKKVKIFEDWHICQIGDLNLYTHPELEINLVRDTQFEITFLGDAFDYENPRFSNEDILEDVKHKIKKGISELEIFNKYSGTYIVFYLNKLNASLIAFNDATAQREIYYYDSRKYGIVLGSQPKIINHFFKAELDDTEKAKEFFASEAFKKRRAYVGDLTEYKAIKHLRANHFLNLTTEKPTRFFPSQTLEGKDLNETAEKAAYMLKGFLKAASYRRRLLIPVSSGWDSRVLLAASRDIADNCHYYVFKLSGQSDNHPDIAIPKKMMAALNLKFEVVNTEEIKLTNDQIKLANASISAPKYEFLNLVFGYWFKFKNHFSVCGNVSEIARMEWAYITGINEYKIATLEKYPFMAFATDYYKKWISTNDALFKKYRFYIMDMLYWEENCGNWVARSNTESQLGTEWYLLYNSRELLTLLLGVDKKYREKQNAKLYYKIAEILWPECVRYPINPGFKKKIISFMQKVGIYSTYRNLLLNYQVLHGK